MGRHSRRETGTDEAGASHPRTPDPEEAAPRPRPAPAPRPAPPGHDRPAFPAPHRATGDGAARGAHPQQHEGGGAWGALPVPGAAAPTGPTVTGSASAPAGGPLAGPRKEYLEAFDGLAPSGRTAPAATPDGASAGPTATASGRWRPVPGPAQRRPGADTAVGDTDTPGIAPEAGGAGGGATDEGDGGERGGAGRSGRGRTLAGVAAAAVATVLAVVAAGQFADGGHQRSTTADGAGAAASPSASAGGEGKHRSADGSSRSTRRAAPLTYAQKMSQPLDLDPHLTASGHFTAVPGHDPAPGRGQRLRYRVDVEDGLPLDGTLFADAVQRTLNDDRSWAHGGVRTFERISSGTPDFVITLASPGTTAAWCAKSGLDTSEENVSCDSAATPRVMINAYRWAQGAETYGPEAMYSYRQMLINHEVGHRLGHNHETCPRDGALAPVMMQQTKFLTLDGRTCRANAWPYPAT
ncbi:DUF3152 domain-containing protein [Streptomyces sp. NPDC059740]|uniref:DUF3152 domain-containing protein n=1 Tax=Streptomyces sp. NPDC059740 TaxID=3346926 RepID=UPI00365DB73D